MPKVVYSVNARIRVPFPQESKDAADAALRAHLGNNGEARHARDKFNADQYQVVRIDVLDDGTKVMCAFR